MVDVPETAVSQLCERLHIDSVFFVQCLEESVIEIREIDGRWDLSNGTVLRLRQLERICNTLYVDVSVALLLLNLNNRIGELEEKIRLLRSPY